MEDVAQAAQAIGKFLQTFTLSSGLRLRFRVKLRSAKPASRINAGSLSFSRCYRLARGR